MAWDFSGLRPLWHCFTDLVSARLGETLPPEKRRVFQRSQILPSLREMYATDKSVWPFLRNRYPT